MTTSPDTFPTRVLPQAAATVLPPRRRWPRRLLVAAAILLVLVVVAVAVGYVYVRNKLDQIPRVAVTGLQPVGTGDPQTILVAGSDSRANESAAAAQHFGSATDVSGQRSDTIVLVHLDPRTSSAAMLSIPRDTFVPIAGTSSSDRINAAFDTSPSDLVATITQDFGITINHYVQEDFSGLQGLTDAVGGVCMNFPYPARDSTPTGRGSETGLAITTSGPHVLNGAEALAFVRSRYYQYYANGAWRAEGTGDIGRIERQHEFIRALASEAVHAAHNPFTGTRVLNRAVKTITVDTAFTSSNMISLGIKLRSFHPAGVPSFTLPYRAVNGYRGFGDVLLPVQSQDAQVIAAWQQFGAPTSAAPPPTSPTGNGRSTPASPASNANSTSTASSGTRPPWDPVAC
ncbi:MAG: LCP family protein [Acidimicrobiia bacterium]|nr:LCP family protein [Acidimicrobiia bacterium]